MNNQNEKELNETRVLEEIRAEMDRKEIKRRVIIIIVITSWFIILALLL